MKKLKLSAMARAILVFLAFGVLGFMLVMFVSGSALVRHGKSTTPEDEVPSTMQTTTPTLVVSQPSASTTVPFASSGSGVTTASMGFKDLTPRDVSDFKLFAPIPRGGPHAPHEIPALEETLERGLLASGASPAHLVVRGTARSDSTRCAWRGVARAPEQKETKQSVTGLS